jgi:beta-galactosidase
MSEVSSIENDGRTIIKGSDFQVVFGREEGSILSFKIRDLELISAGPHENYFRAPTDFDLLMGNPKANIHLWRAAGYDRLVRKVLSFEPAS